MKRKLLFFINPISGTKNKKNIEAIIRKKCLKNEIDFDIAYTNAEGKYHQIEHRIIKEGFTDIIMVGGDGVALERVMPVLLAMGKKVTHIGGAGSGQVCKAANQIMVAAQMVAMGELLVFSKKCGADPTKVVEAIKSGAAQCWTLDVKPQRLFDGNREPGFKASMQSKDLGIIMESAKEFGVPLPTTAVNAQLFQAMLQNGMGDKDNSAVVAILEQMGGCEII